MTGSYYALWHCRVDERGCDHDLLLGIYSTQEKAEQGLALLRDQPGFRDFPECFEILEGTVDQTHMLEGFVIAWGDEEPEPSNAPG